MELFDSQGSPGFRGWTKGVFLQVAFGYAETPVSGGLSPPIERHGIAGGGE